MTTFWYRRLDSQKIHTHGSDHGDIRSFHQYATSLDSFVIEESFQLTGHFSKTF
jgi:hypothetical protein